MNFEKLNERTVIEDDSSPMSKEDYDKVAKAMEKADGDDTPILVNDGETLSIVGDANKTETKRNEYVVSFTTPKSKFKNKPDEKTFETFEEIDGYYRFSLKFEDVEITPRKNMKVVDSMLKIIPFFKKLGEQGEVEDLTSVEQAQMLLGASEDIHLALYNFVAIFLNIDDELGEYMLPTSVISNVAKIFDNHPEIVNESDIFFG